MALKNPPILAEDFESFLELDENQDRMFELINGEIYEKMSSLMPSYFNVQIISSLNMFVNEHDLGFVTGPDGGYKVGHSRIVPDVAFLSKARQARLLEKGFNPILPDFIVEMVSPSDMQQQARVTEKIELYRQAQIPLFWYVYPSRLEVDVYEDGELIRTAKVGDILDGGKVLVGWTIAVKDIFRIRE